MTPTYLFYDIESSGLSKCFDQVLQFAAIRTDLEFNEIERYETIIRVNPDIIPAPLATITHHLGIEACAKGVNEYEGIQHIHQILNEPGTISLGYNTLTFDDEFLRFSFYRNLLTPYTHQYANGCKRMDLYPMTIFYHLFKPEALEHWPEIDKRISLKLEHLSDANQLASGPAHNAMVDVEATLALAQKLRQSNDMWQYLLQYFDKQKDQARCQELPIVMESDTHQHHEGLMVLGRFGTRCHYMAPVLSIGPHQHYKNQSLWLRMDLPELRECSLDNLDEKSWVVNKKFSEPGFLLPPAPKYLDKIKAERVKEAKENKRWLSEHPNLLREIIQYHRNYQYPFVPEADVDTALYQKGFLSDSVMAKCRDFHRKDWPGRAQMLGTFGDSDVEEMAIRIIGRHQPDQLPSEAMQAFQAYLQQVYTHDQEGAMVDYTHKPRMTLAEAELQYAEAVKRELSGSQQRLLQELAEHLQMQQEAYQ